MAVRTKRVEFRLSTHDLEALDARRGSADRSTYLRALIHHGTITAAGGYTADARQTHDDIAGTGKQDDPYKICAEGHQWQRQGEYFDTCRVCGAERKHKTGTR